MTPPILALTYHWDPAAAWNALPSILGGLRVSLLLAVLVYLTTFPSGLAVVALRRSRLRPISAAAYIYTELFRTTPFLVQLLWMYYVLPTAFHINLDPFVTGFLVLSLNLTAFMSEAFRASILSIDRGQSEAALSSGMSGWQVQRLVILPQAVRRVIPLLAAIWISLLKDTSLVALIGVQEAMFQAQTAVIDTFRPMEILTLVALVYFLVTYPQSLLINRLFERHRVIE